MAKDKKDRKSKSAKNGRGGCKCGKKPQVAGTKRYFNVSYTVYECSSTDNCTAEGEGDTWVGSNTEVDIQIEVTPEQLREYDGVQVNVSPVEDDRIAAYDDRLHPLYAARTTAGDTKWVRFEMPGWIAPRKAVWKLYTDKPPCKLKIKIKRQ